MTLYVIKDFRIRLILQGWLLHDWINLTYQILLLPFSDIPDYDDIFKDDDDEEDEEFEGGSDDDEVLERENELELWITRKNFESFVDVTYNYCNLVYNDHPWESKFVAVIQR